ncbi:TlyA family RNA methyltransferase [Campylobacter sp. FMV-PI01]|uniref:TlyA family RNA methyltransferase n=1 Tax=Campylobacter portucalensis TaxID=2608384 RepID=A0A6L5WLT1_9BACT|nr:TlyA family RNA methyltransferase [Campylobacter portucalensis]MSN96975.1 TlyA family RNA methyltransferase [Campylobacter portucalensis]
MRADLYTANALNISRNRAIELIRSGQILLDDMVLSKPSFDIKSGKISAINEIYVSRAALKLKLFLENVGINLKDKVCIDIGSSTGGFTQILLENGAKSVTCVDVGSNQLHQNLRDNDRVKVFENLDIRDFKTNQIYEILTCDVSFISLNLIMPYLINLFSEFAIMLFKPQFEVGKMVKRDKNGVVVDQKSILKSMQKFELDCAKLGLIFVEKRYSKIKGKSGNEEIFYLFKKMY